MDAREVIARAVAPHGWAEAEGGGLLWTRRFDREDAFHKADDILAALAANQLAVVGSFQIASAHFAGWCEGQSLDGGILRKIDVTFAEEFLRDLAISPSPLSTGDRR